MAYITLLHHTSTSTFGGLLMREFKLPADLSFNRGQIRDPKSYAAENGCASWLYLNGAEFASMDGGISYDEVRAAVPQSANVISDPPRVLDLNLARRHVTALDELPRPTLLSCRTGPRASAVAYMYAGLKQGSKPDDVLTAAEKDDAPFIQFAEYRDWVRSSIVALSES